MEEKEKMDKTQETSAYPLNSRLLIANPSVGLMVLMSSPFKALTIVVLPELSRPTTSNLMCFSRIFIFLRILANVIMNPNVTYFFGATAQLNSIHMPTQQAEAFSALAEAMNKAANASSTLASQVSTVEAAAAAAASFLAAEESATSSSAAHNALHSALKALDSLIERQSELDDAIATLDSTAGLAGIKPVLAASASALGAVRATSKVASGSSAVRARSSALLESVLDALPRAWVKWWSPERARSIFRNALRGWLTGESADDGRSAPLWAPDVLAVPLGIVRLVGSIGGPRATGALASMHKSWSAAAAAVAGETIAERARVATTNAADSPAAANRALTAFFGDVSAALDRTAVVYSLLWIIAPPPKPGSVEVLMPNLGTVLRPVPAASSIHAAMWARAPPAGPESRIGSAPITAAGQALAEAAVPHIAQTLSAVKSSLEKAPSGSMRAANVLWSALSTSVTWLGSPGGLAWLFLRAAWSVGTPPDVRDDDARRSWLHTWLSGSPGDVIPDQIATPIANMSRQAARAIAAVDGGGFWEEMLWEANTPPESALASAFVVLAAPAAFVRDTPTRNRLDAAAASAWAALQVAGGGANKSLPQGGTVRTVYAGFAKRSLLSAASGVQSTPTLPWGSSVWAADLPWAVETFMPEFWRVVANPVFDPSPEGTTAPARPSGFLAGLTSKVLGTESNDVTEDANAQQRRMDAQKRKRGLSSGLEALM